MPVDILPRLEAFAVMRDSGEALRRWPAGRLTTICMEADPCPACGGQVHWAKGMTYCGHRGCRYSWAPNGG